MKIHSEECRMWHKPDNKQVTDVQNFLKFSRILTFSHVWRQSC